MRSRKPARQRLFVVAALIERRGRVLLSQRRADAVRSYLVERGYQGDLIKAHGLGKDSPVADNSSAEGRANNRRVEIVIAHEPHASNP